MSLIENDIELKTKLGLDDNHELSKADKIEYIDAQINAIKQQLWRSRVDLMINQAVKTNTDQEKKAVSDKIFEHENDCKRYAEAITILNDIRKSL